MTVKLRGFEFADADGHRQPTHRRQVDRRELDGLVAAHPHEIVDVALGDRRKVECPADQQQPGDAIADDRRRTLGRHHRREVRAGGVAAEDQSRRRCVGGGPSRKEGREPGADGIDDVGERRLGGERIPHGDMVDPQVRHRCRIARPVVDRALLPPAAVEHREGQFAGAVGREDLDHLALPCAVAKGLVTAGTRCRCAGSSRAQAPGAHGPGGISCGATR